MRKIFEKFRVDSSWLLDQLAKQILAIFQNTLHNTNFKNNFQNIENFSKRQIHLCIHSNMDHYKGCHNNGLFSKHFQTHTQSTISNNWKHHFKQLKMQGKWSKQVTKSPWITMDRKGANTFPFYNLLPEPKKTSQRFFLFFLTFP